MRLSEFIKAGKQPPPNAVNSSPGQTPEEVVEILKRECQPFLQATNNLEYNLYRGIRSIIPFDGQILHSTRCPIGRRPKDSPLFLHKVADKWFFDKTGIAFRSNAIFCTGNAAEAIEYGAVYLMIPIGNFDFCYSPKVEDLYKEFDRPLFSGYMTESEKETYAAKLIAAFDDAKYKFNTTVDGFRLGVTSGNEMMIHCDHYYIMPFYDEQTKKVLSLL